MYSNLEIASLIFGILSIPCSLAFGVGLIPGIIGFVFAMKARKDAYCTGMANGGLICSIIGMIFSVVAIIIIGFVILSKL
ncbi:MAG: hypothetical protein E7295_04710 [Lachnospiraceae bacterium]|nr:hypothetical protein [Lachnospiraceae bacterium]